jgi:hypothetical protein
MRVGWLAAVAGSSYCLFFSELERGGWVSHEVSIETQTPRSSIDWKGFLTYCCAVHWHDLGHTSSQSV